MTRYLSGLCVAGLGLCGGGWLLVAAAAFGGAAGGPAGLVNLATGACLVVISAASLACWVVAWRRRLHADGVLPPRSLLVSRRPQAPPDRTPGGPAVATWVPAAAEMPAGLSARPAPAPRAPVWQADDELLWLAESEEAWW